MKYIILDEDGETVIQAGNAPSLPTGAIEIQTPYTSQQMVQCRYVEQTVEVEEVVDYTEEGDEIIGIVTYTGMVLEPRPQLSPMNRVGNQITVPNIPLGSQIVVHDDVGQEALLDMTTSEDDYLLDVTLPDVGKYALDIYPPHPWFPATYKIEVAS